jgi:hypothetical protein
LNSRFSGRQGYKAGKRNICHEGLIHDTAKSAFAPAWQYSGLMKAKR